MHADQLHRRQLHRGAEGVSLARHGRQGIDHAVRRDRLHLGRLSSKFFNLPGGPIGFVLGAEYRTDNVAYKQDRARQLGYTFYNAIPSFTAPKAEVKEAFGEIRLPILKDLPFLHELEVGRRGACVRLQARHDRHGLGLQCQRASTRRSPGFGSAAIMPARSALRTRSNCSRRSARTSRLGSTDPCACDQFVRVAVTRAANCIAAGRSGRVRLHSLYSARSAS